MTDRLHVSTILNVDELDKLVEEGLINARKHPTLDLWIYNYSKTASYVFRGMDNWPNAAIQCRGLVLDAEQNIVARPFPKFFGIDEHSRSDILFSSPFTITDKMDGSLGILYSCYKYPGEKVELGPYSGPRRFAIATRGSFDSDQAIKATQILDTKYGHLFHDIDGYDQFHYVSDDEMHEVTLLFEIIYPSNRIVVDYRGVEDLVLLAMIDNVTGRDIPRSEWHFDDEFPPIVKEYDINCKPREVLEALGADDGKTEGFVLNFDHRGKNVRVKMKYAEYMRLHKVVTGVSTKTVWEYLKGGLSFDELMDRVPDEFNEWLTQVIADLQAQFNAIEVTAAREFGEIESKLVRLGIYDRKLFAEEAKSKTETHLIFMIKDGKTDEFREAIWKRILPTFAKPFTQDIDS